MDFEEFFETQRSQHKNSNKLHHDHESDFRHSRSNIKGKNHFGQHEIITLLKRNKKYRNIVMLIIFGLLIIITAAIIALWPLIYELGSSIWNQGGEKIINESKQIIKP